MQDEEDSLNEEESIDEPTEALLETDSDRDENELTRNFLAESVGLNVSVKYFMLLLIKSDTKNNTNTNIIINILNGLFCTHIYIFFIFTLK